MKHENFRSNTKLLCNFNGISISQLSLILFSNERRLYDIINNKPIKIRDEELQAIASYFNIDVEVLKYKKAFLEFK